jgi:hypothetical protein
LSELHVRQIRAALHQHFDGLLDLADYDGKGADETESAFLTRAQAGFVLAYLANEDPKDVASALTDGYGDNGIDALYYHASERVLYVVQSKWRHQGTGSVDRGELQKFLKGFRDLINARWTKFNAKVQALATTIEPALNDSSTRIVLVIAYTGQDPLAAEIQQDLKELVDEVNNPTEIVSTQVLRQGDIYAAVAQGIEGAPIDLDVALYDWGQVREPYVAFYGQVAASDVASWYAAHQSRLFAPNIRMFLGPTDVNNTIVESLGSAPKDFWYFNNGITALCRTIAKKPIGGATRETGYFDCRDLRVVNGAQTVGAIATAFGKNPDKVSEARVSIRIVALEACPPEFERQITRYNNTQNRIDRRDFVSLDSQQERLRNELQLEAIQYVYKSGDVVVSANTGFDLTEATVARACRQSDSAWAVQAKREIGKLWEDLDKAPYKLLFNASVTGPTLWRQVQIVRVVEVALAGHRSDADGRRRLLAVHGNRLITHLVMNCLVAGIVDGSGALDGAAAKQLMDMTEKVFEAVLMSVNAEYGDAYLASVFKNAAKCKVLKEKFDCPE